MKGPSNMEIKYEGNNLKMEWTYTITRFQHETKLSGMITQFIINLNTTILKMGNIRRVLFLYKDKTTGQFCFTTTEPEESIHYETILTRSNKKQVTIQLPQELLGLKENIPQKAIINIYPHLKDSETGSSPKITMDIVDLPPEVNEPSLEIIKGEKYLSWIIETGEKTPKSLIQFLTLEETETIDNTNDQLNVLVNIETLATQILPIGNEE